ncbi:methylated-DNA--[protein]-cysteine S-methyltransferase [Variovorax sp. HJSM1_2]|uniref:methylated-DNA--[protein]-cysteine S-methyltransferase n=1 Tax=Variovorax sp. HJSM1_2 TaxID=3366263 RepID=UPI003BE3259B
MSPSLHHAFFDTPLGRCGVAWGTSGLCAVQLPEVNPARALERIHSRAPGSVEATPPAAVQQAMDRIAALLGGEMDDLLDIALDMHGISPFYQRVYALARQIPPGQTTSYGAMAEALQSPGSARAIGQALGFNPFAPVVPCHRVLAANGGAGGFSAAGGLNTKLRMLEIERAVLGQGPGLFDAL